MDMKKKIIVFFLILISIFSYSLKENYTTPNSSIYLLQLNGIINPVTSQYVVSGIEDAEAEEAECLILQLDTPGGLDTSMRDIIKKMLNSTIPIIVYISPSGGRAASAGVFITLASNIAAMAPGTNIGAAHPVVMGGEEIDEELKTKMVNDAAAYIKTIAEKRGRNVEWAEKAVRERDISYLGLCSFPEHTYKLWRIPAHHLRYCALSYRSIYSYLWSFYCRWSDFPCFRFFYAV